MPFPAQVKFPQNYINELYKNLLWLQIKANYSKNLNQARMLQATQSFMIKQYLQINVTTIGGLCLCLCKVLTNWEMSCHK